MSHESDDNHEASETLANLENRFSSLMKGLSWSNFIAILEKHINDPIIEDLLANPDKYTLRSSVDHGLGPVITFDNADGFSISIVDQWNKDHDRRYERVEKHPTDKR